MKGALAQGVKVGAAGVDLVRRNQVGLTVLIYHRVGGIGGSVDLDPPRFDEQVAEIAASGRAQTLDQGVAEVMAPGATPKAQVALTFDDGTVDFVEHAVPILERHQVPALLYLATRFADDQIDFPGGGPAVSWGALRDALSTGLVTIGSHTHGHLLLDRTGPAELEADLDRSIQLIEDELGVTPQHFAYPKAVLGSAEAQAAVKQRFTSAAVAGTRPNLPGRTDPYRLARSPIQVSDGMRWFRKKVDGGMRLEDDLRQWANRRRYADATG